MKHLSILMRLLGSIFTPMSHRFSVDLADLSRHRAAIMGIAMLLIMFFHTSGLQCGTLGFAINRCGNVGVDMFLFLSGVGLWFSFSRNSSLRHFFLRRYLRIYPAWLLVAGYFYLSDYLAHGRQSADLWELVANISVNWCFWQRDAWEFWFIPSIMMMYTFAPAYMHLIRRQELWRWLPVVAMVFCVMVQYVAPLHHAVSHIEIFWSRIPIFLIGINMGQSIREGHRYEGSSLWFILLLFALSAYTCITLEDGLRGRFPLFMERMVYIPLSITLMLLCCQMLRRLPHLVDTMFAFVGGVSLEIYLIHVNYILPLIKPLHWGFWGTSLSMIALSVPAAWLLHQLIEKGIVRRIERIIQK